MLRTFAVSLGGGLLATVLFVGPTAADDKKEAKEGSVEAIMKKLHGGGAKALHKTAAKLVKEDEVKWDDVAKLTKEYAALTTALAKAKPEKGEQKTWDEFAKTYAAAAKELDDAAAKKDKKGASAAFEKLNASCDACHEKHRD